MISGNLQEFIIHKIGNKSLDENLFLTKKTILLDDELKNILNSYFFSSFKNEERYKLHHEFDINLNEVYNCTSKIFDDVNCLQEQSENIAKHLYDQSDHPNIKSGELYVAYFTNCIVDGVETEAIGIFKSENRDIFLDVKQNFEGFDISSKQGININKLDKGCFIFNLKKEEGYILSIIDNTNKSKDAQYWKDNFLKVIILNNEFHQTNQFLTLARQFVSKQLDEDFEITKTDKIDLLNRSVDYFKNHENFDKDEFEEQVFADDEVIQSFRKFDNVYREENKLELDDNFFISENAVKKQSRIFKSVLKLDKNFHIYIHGNKDMIEQGTDDDGRKYYKIYYEQEN
ncbi:MAG TPA: nucleoid-associated protein [Edaphocola sp.]|nr:nucleoid-associated protein [Edaphocola sp.]